MYVFQHHPDKTHQTNKITELVNVLEDWDEDRELEYDQAPRNAIRMEAVLALSVNRCH